MVSMIKFTNLNSKQKTIFGLDIAITVPFPNSGSGSMVQIYRGSQNGLILTPAQVSFSGSINFFNKIKENFLPTFLKVLYAPGVSGFGWAIQGLFDYDNNGYPGDLLTER